MTAWELIPGKRNAHAIGIAPPSKFVQEATGQAPPEPIDKRNPAAVAYRNSGRRRAAWLERPALHLRKEKTLQKKQQRLDGKTVTDATVRPL